jgi:hypothetical protein
MIYSKYELEAPMSILNKIAYYQNQRNEILNQMLAKELVQTSNREGIREIAENLWNKNKNISSDCLKVLYEIGYINPELIQDYVNDFLKLLHSKENRMVWGAMIGLATIADRRAGEIWAHLDDVLAVIEHGSVITVVAGVKMLAKVAAAGEKYQEKIFPFLLQHLETCIPRDVPTHAESMLCAVDKKNKEGFLSVLDMRRPELSPTQLTRLKKVFKKSPSFIVMIS